MTTNRLINLGVTLDNAIIDHLFQPMANACRRLGSPKELALFCLMGYIVSEIADAVILQRMGLRNITSYVTTGFCLAGGTYLYRHTSQFDTGESALNVLREIPVYRVIRLFMLMFFMVQLAYSFITANYALVSLAASLLYAAFFYFLACRKPPPKERRATSLNRLARAGSA